MSKDINDKINTLQKGLTQANLLPHNILETLVRLCSIFPTETSTNFRRRIIPLICKYYKIDYKEVIISNIEDDKFDYDYTPLRCLVKNFLFDMVKKSKEDLAWVECNIEFLKDSLDATNYSEIKDFLETIPVFPNQNHILCLQKDLFKESDFPAKQEDSDFLKTIYKEAVSDVKSLLVINEFAELIPHNNLKTGLDLSSYLEKEFKKHSYQDIANHPNKKMIFDIIQKITDNDEWVNLFGDLNSNKALIMMAKISDDDVKDDLFSIIGLDNSKISKLGELSRNPQLDKIIDLGTIALEEERRSRADFGFKKTIGVHIEDLVRNKIDKEIENLTVTVNEEQGGQDIVIAVNSEIVYFIEVKSRWDSKSSITMSNLQIKNAVKNKNRYSLCCVEMSDYHPEDGSRYDVKDISEIIDRIKFVNDIGTRIEPLIVNAISMDGKEDEVKLTDEYRATVPQPVVEKGMIMEGFVAHLVKIIEKFMEQSKC